MNNLHLALGSKRATWLGGAIYSEGHEVTSAKYQTVRVATLPTPFREQAQDFAGILSVPK
jgi:hypothetical protein